MSAIFGIIDRFRHAIHPACTGRMIAALAHRGLEGQSGERGLGFTLGHCLLDTAGTGQAMGCLVVEDDIVVVGDYSPFRRLVRFGRSVRRRLGPPSAQLDPCSVSINQKFGAKKGVLARFRKQNRRPAVQAFTEQSVDYDMLIGPLQSYAFEILHRIADAAGVEARYPFWDKRLVEFCFSLDPAEKSNNGSGRLIMRPAMEGILPPTVRWRRFKSDFTKHIAESIILYHILRLA